MSRRRLILILLCLPLLLLLSSRRAKAQENPPRFEPGPCPMDLADLEGLRCGTLVTLEAYDEPGGANVELPVVILSSLGDGSAAEPVVFSKGGPGATSLWTVPILFRSPWRQDREIIILEQRGSAAAQPSLDCPPGLLVQEAQPCLESLRERGLALGHFTTTAMVADLVALRQALGVQRWNLYGDAYSSRVMLLTLAADPDGVQAAVLDALHPPEANVYESGAANFERALEDFFEGCAAEPDCAAAYPNLERRFWALIGRLNESPAELIVGRERTGEPIVIRVDGDWFLSQTFDALYSAQRPVDPLAYWPLLVSQLEQSQYDYLLSWLASPVIAWEERLAFGAYFAAMCQDEYALSDPALVQAQEKAYPTLARWAAGAFGRSVCQAWQLPPGAEANRQPVRSDVPVLLLAGSHAPVTPPAWARQAAANLPNSHLVEFPDRGQWFSASDGCAQEVVAAFLENPGRAPDGSCLAEGGAGIVLPGQVRLAPGLFRLYDEILGPSGHAGRTALWWMSLTLSGLTLLYLLVAGLAYLALDRRFNGATGAAAIGLHLVAGVTAGLNLTFALSLSGLLRELAVSAPPLLHFGLPAVSGRLLLLPAISNALTALLLLGAFALWIRRDWALWTRVAFSLATLGAAIFASLMAYWGLLPF